VRVGAVMGVVEAVGVRNDDVASSRKARSEQRHQQGGADESAQELSDDEAGHGGGGDAGEAVGQGSADGDGGVGELVEEVNQ
jgi:hypothetical protein